MGFNHGLSKIIIDQSEENIILHTDVQPSDEKTTNLTDSSQNYLYYPEPLTRASTGSAFRNPVCRASRLSEEKSTSYFFKKPYFEECDLESNQTLAYYECFFYELLRLVDNEQPKAIVVLDAKGHPAIASTEIPNFQTITKLTGIYINNPDLQLANNEFRLLRQKFANGVYRGLVYKLAWRWFLDDIDASNSNLGINQAGNVINIDGGLAFCKVIVDPEFKDPYRHEITKRDFLKFPYIQDFKPAYWASTHFKEENTKKNIRNKKKQKIKAKLSVLDGTNFFANQRHEFYRGALEFILLPPEFFALFMARIASDITEMHLCGKREIIDDYFATRINDVPNYVKQRQLTILNLCIEDDDFKEYLGTQGQGPDDFNRLLDNVKSYATIGEDKITDLMPNLIDDITFNFEKLKKHVKELDETKDQVENKAAIESTNLPQSSNSIPPQVKPAAEVSVKQNSFPWLDMIKGAGSALAISGMFAACFLLYGSLTLATLGSNVLLTVCIGVGIALFGGSVGLMCADEVVNDKVDNITPTQPIPPTPPSLISPGIKQILKNQANKEIKGETYKQLIVEHEEAAQEKVVVSSKPISIQTKLSDLPEVSVVIPAVKNSLDMVPNLPSPPLLGMK